MIFLLFNKNRGKRNMIFVILSSGKNAVWLDMENGGTPLHYSKDATGDFKSIHHGIREVLVLHCQGPKYIRPDEFLREFLPQRIWIRLSGAERLSDSLAESAKKIFNELSSDDPNLMIVGLAAESGSSIVLIPQPSVYIQKTHHIEHFLRVVGNVKQE
jgi:hypothetical protein